jgi:hypothetical protein
MHPSDPCHDSSTGEISDTACNNDSYLSQSCTFTWRPSPSEPSTILARPAPSPLQPFTRDNFKDPYERKYLKEQQQHARPDLRVDAGPHLARGHTVMGCRWRRLPRRAATLGNIYRPSRGPALTLTAGRTNCPLRGLVQFSQRGHDKTEMSTSSANRQGSEQN